MSYITRVSSAVLVLSIAVLACGVPAVATPPSDSDAINTAVAETVIARFVQEALSQTLTPTLVPTLTFTPEPPALTPTETVTLSPTLTATPFFTATPVVPQISVSVPTNCRVGPGRVYRRVGAILVGQIAEVYGRDPTGRYWYIRNPSSSSGFCWAWGEYATVSGNIALLPVYTPPPTPTPTFTPTPSPNFEAFFVGLDTCASVGWWAEIELENTGSIPFRSMGITVRDTVTDVVVASFTDGFTNMDGCTSTVTRDILRVDRSPVISSPAFNYNPAGHRLRATIILCSDTGQRGTCVTKTIVFTP
jgi:hypothetical protein